MTVEAGVVILAEERCSLLFARRLVLVALRSKVIGSSVSQRITMSRRMESKIQLRYVPQPRITDERQSSSPAVRNTST